MSNPSAETNTIRRTERGHVHKEAFCLMWYQCRACKHLERIWNSRDGVTPFGTDCPSCGEDVLYHVAWGRDEYAPEHKLRWGQKFWRDGMPEEAEAIMRRRIESCRGTEYEIKDPAYAERLIREAREPTEASGGEFRKVWPTLAVYTGELS